MSKLNIFGKNIKVLLDLFNLFKYDKQEAKELTVRKVYDAISNLKNIELLLTSMENLENNHIFDLISRKNIRLHVSNIRRMISFLEKYKNSIQSGKYPREVGPTEDEYLSVIGGSDTLKNIYDVIYPNRASIYAQLVNNSPQGMISIYKDMLIN